ncbi:hypothetical protein, partial [Succinivibrio sp.]|uniref:hypothetical protein n=1 Tax=Succinivibrio sp. TaxID=2053619 RepID=UPI0038697458
LKTNWEILDQKVADVTALQQAVAGALHREIVESLPTTDIDPNTIYMILSGTSATENVYNEYMYVNNAWELIGTSATDLTNYYTKAEVDGKLLLKASASDLTSHTGNTDIHVTTADKNKWNNNTYVFRYSSTALVASSTNSNALLDNTDNLKVGDKVIDSSGVLFSITAIDTANSTFTIGTALIDLAQDSDVVHKSGDETVGGKKTFRDDLTIYNYDSSQNTRNLNISSSKIQVGDTSNSDTFGVRFNAGASYVAQILAVNDLTGTQNLQFSVRTKDSLNNFINSAIRLRIFANGNSSFEPGANNSISLGSSLNKWSKIYGTEYYYGSNNVEFSNKFVTTDTAQDVTANKNFKGLITTIPDSPLWTVNTNTTADITSLAPSCIHVESKPAGSLTDLSGGAWYVAQIGTGCFFFRHNTGTDIRYKHFPTNVVSKICVMSNDNKFISDLIPDTTNTYKLGDSNFKWSTINGLNPSSLGMPDLDNGIDISSYITVVANANKESLYTPPANGWISVALTRTGGANMAVMLKQGNFASSGRNIQQENGTTTCNAMLPVKGGVQVSINSALADGIDFAYFYPCQGNV